MLETFRGSTHDHNELGNLLPSVFGGSFLYITTCSGCNQPSERYEKFMEVSVPIIDSEDASRNKGLNSDVDIQQCLDSYLHPEQLDGDNQYFCATCDKKCDAVRELVFNQLPPVLNIQLARYVFDRKTLAKQKVRTKVLLPRTIDVPFIGGSKRSKKRKTRVTNDTEQAQYVLCAVQNHLGNSAYEGHYIGM